MLNIVYLDGKTLNPGDLSWDELKSLGHVKIYDQSTPEEGIARALDAEIVIINKHVLDENTIAQLPKLTCICITATGYNNVDISAAKKRNIPVCNVSGYSTMSTAQQTIALLLELTNQCGFYNNEVTSGTWTDSGLVTYNPRPAIELAGSTMGILGLGNIGLQVGRIATAIGMKVIGYKRSMTSGNIEDIEMVELSELFKRSDVLSLHAPLNDQSRHIVNRTNIDLMKSSSFIVNTGRGDLIHETDLKNALEANRIAGAALDVLSTEPPPRNHPLIGLSNCIVTPHVAWASKASRARLLSATIENITAFVNGEPKNVIV